ncbi:MAG: tetratricopeptide repeat protein [Lachnospiraceae bacterium]
MDKYEFNVKVEQIRKLVNKEDYETAMKIADGIDWKKVRNANLLSMVAQVYEKNEEYQDAKDILLLAFERAPIGKRLLYKLTELAVKEGNMEEAEAYYREFCDLSADDPRQYLLRYMILKEKGAPAEQLIHSLESYTSEELDEKWLCELAELYHEIGNEPMCVATCDKIMLMFGLGKYVDKAMELKIQYAPLTKYQMDLVENREKYEEKLRAVEQSYGVEGRGIEPDDDFSLPEEPVREETVRIVPEPVLEITDEEDSRPYEQEELVAEVKQAEVEEHLAQEMSKLSVEGYKDDSDDQGKTRVLDEIKRAQILNQETMVLPKLTRAERPKEPKAPAGALLQPEPEIEPEVLPEPELSKLTNHVMIEAKNPERGFEKALETLKQIQIETGVKNPVAKISGTKLNKIGILASREKLSGKDLVIEEAGDLEAVQLAELEQLMREDASEMRIILIDNPRQMEQLHAQNASLASKFECIGSDDEAPRPRQEQHIPERIAEPEAPAVPEVDDRPVRHIIPNRDSAMRVPDAVERYPEARDDGEQMDIDEFAQYACKYATEIDCSITGKSMLALYERIEIMEEDGILLTRTNAEALIEEAADRAERPPIGKRITGIFSAKYDKDGLLILKEEHFI